MSSMSERGSVSTLLVAVMFLGCVLLVAITGVGQFLVARERVVTAAEAGALAAAPVTFRPFGASGSAADEADRLVRANGAMLLRCDCPPDPTYYPRTATVTARSTVAILGFREVELEYTAAAEFRPVDLLPGPGEGPLADYPTSKP